MDPAIDSDRQTGRKFIISSSLRLGDMLCTVYHLVGTEQKIAKKNREEIRILDSNLTFCKDVRLFFKQLKKDFMMSRNKAVVILAFGVLFGFSSNTRAI